MLPGGVVPFENSHAGDVSAVLDLCYNHPALWVVDVYDLPISQNLLVLPGTKLDHDQKTSTATSRPSPRVRPF